MIQRHDILRTAVVWEGLETPVQVVWREAPMSLQTLNVEDMRVTGTDTTLTGTDDVAACLQQHFDPSHTRMDVQRAPMIAAYKVADPKQDRWLLCFLFHHLCNDHTTLEILVEEVMAHLSNQTKHLPQPLPFRNFVAQACMGLDREAHLAYFRAQLGDIDEPCAPFGLLELQDHQTIEALHLAVDDTLARRIRAQVRLRKMSAASLFHLAWGLVVRAATGRDDVVFGTVLFGRMGGGEGADRALGMFLNTLPLRLSLAQISVDEALEQTHQRLMALLDHEHVSLALVQQW
ncbi:condensation domain-containing protein [Vibrio sp. PP-XX7]